MLAWLPYPPLSLLRLTDPKIDVSNKDYFEVHGRFIVGSFSNEKRSLGVRIGNACFNNSPILKI